MDSCIQVRLLLLRGYGKVILGSTGRKEGNSRNFLILAVIYAHALGGRHERSLTIRSKHNHLP